MKTEWLKTPGEDHWRANLGPYKASVVHTSFGFAYTVSDGVRVLRSGQVATLEAAQLRAEQAVGRPG